MDTPVKETVDPIDKMFRYLGLLLTIASAALTYAWASTFKIHWLVDFILPFGLIGASVASAYAWPRVIERGRVLGWKAALPVVAFAGLFTATDVVSNFGSVAWQRTVDMDAAAMQNARYEDVRKAVAEDEAKLKLLEGNLLSLQTRNAWAASANATALRQMLKEKQEAADREAARVRCGRICEGLKDEVIALTEKIGTIEQRDDLSKRIEFTRKAIAERRATAGKTEKAQSGAALSTESFASMFTLSRSPNENAMHWTDKGLSWLVAAFFTFGAMGCNIFGWGNMACALRTGSTSPIAFAPETSKSWDNTKTVVPAPLVPKDNVTIVNLPEDSSLRDMLRSLSNLKNLQTRTA